MQLKFHISRHLIAAVVLALFVLPLSATASIVMPDAVSPDVEQMIADSGVGSTAAAPSTGQSDSAPNDEQDESDEKLLARLLSANSSPGSSTSGTSSSAGANGGAPSALASDVSPASDADIVASVCSERHLTLPMPPGNELLRPPQSV